MWITEYKCLQEENRKMNEKLHKLGLQMECRQLTSIQHVQYCEKDHMKFDEKRIVYNSGCELRNIPTTADENKRTIIAD